MSNEKKSLKRRTVLQTIGISVVGTSVYAGTVAADDHLIEVSPTSLTLDEGETGEVEVTIVGPPFGRTDVDVGGDVPATPDEFRLSGEEDSQPVELTGVEDGGAATFSASLPRGDTQSVDVNVEEPEIGPECPEIPLNLEEQYPLEGLSNPFTVEVQLEQNGTPFGGTSDLDVTVTDYLGNFSEAPNDSLNGSTNVTFEDGLGTFTIGEPGTDPDLELGFLGFVPTVDDVETIEVSSPDGQVTRLGIC